MKGMGVNAVRLPITPRFLLNDTNTSYINFSDNPNLQGLGSLQVLDTILKYLDAEGIYFVLDFQNYDGSDITPLWYTSYYS